MDKVKGQLIGKSGFEKPPRGDFAGISSKDKSHYLHALIQTLALSPEFKQELYLWDFDEVKHETKETSLTYQLQLLMGKLQLTDRASHPSDDLKASLLDETRKKLGEVDLDEFWDAFMDELERHTKWIDLEPELNKERKRKRQKKFTEEQKAIDDENERRSIPLSIPNKMFDAVYNEVVTSGSQFGETISEEKVLRHFAVDVGAGHETIESAIAEKFADTQSGDVTTHIRFKRLPKFLSVPLKRFSNGKKTDAMAFPQVLNLNHLDLQEEADRDADQMARQPGIDVSEEGKSVWVPPVHPPKEEPKTPLKANPVIVGNRFFKAAPEEITNMIAEAQESGRSVYELYAVVAHGESSDPGSGRYTAYVKDFATYAWYQFDDDVKVVKAEQAELDGLVGGNGPIAHMLIYRKTDDTRIQKVDNGNVTPDVKDIYEAETYARLVATQWQLLNLHVHYKTESKLFTIKKKHPVQRLYDEAFAALAVEGEQSSYALRGYSHSEDLYREMFAGKALEESLESQNIYNYKHLVIVSTAEDAKEQFDYENIVVKVHVWDPSCEDPEIKAKPLTEKVNYYRISLSKASCLRDLMTQIAERSGIAVEDQFITRQNLRQEHGLVRVLSAKDNLDLRLGTVYIYDGTEIFVEPMPESNEACKWAPEIREEGNRYTVFFNPLTSKDSNSETHSENIVMLRSDTLLSLKEAISARINVAMDQFYFRLESFDGIELKDLGKELHEANVKHTSVIHLTKMPPCTPDQQRLFFRGMYLTKTMLEYKQPLAKFPSVELCIDKHLTIEQIKEIVGPQWSKAGTFKVNYEGPKKLRMREKKHKDTRMIRTLHDHQVLGDLGIQEMTQFMLDYLQEEETLTPELEVFNLRSWDMDIDNKVATPSPLKEIFLPLNSTIEQLLDKLAEECPSMERDYLRVCTISDPNNVTNDSLKKEDWHPKYLDENDKSTLMKPDWDLSQGGLLFSCMDKRHFDIVINKKDVDSISAPNPRTS